MGQLAKKRNLLARKLICRLRRRHHILACFLPVRRGIHKHIWRLHRKLIIELARDIPGVTDETLVDNARKLLDVALINHTNHPNYIRNILTKDWRLSLEGEKVEPITNIDRKVYRERLERLYAKRGKPRISSSRKQPKIIVKRKRWVDALSWQQ